jgi:hypothetical protein
VIEIGPGFRTLSVMLNTTKKTHISLELLTALAASTALACGGGSLETQDDDGAADAGQDAAADAGGGGGGGPGPARDTGGGGGEDAGAGEDGGGVEEDGGGGVEDAGGPIDPVETASCAARSAEIAAAGTVKFTVSPLPNGQVQIAGGGTRTLRQVVQAAEPGDVIELEDGTYTFPEGGDGAFTGLYFTKPDVTLRSKSGDASEVILDSAYVDHGNGSAPITVAAPGVVLSGFTVKRSIYHLVHLWADGDDALVHDVTMVDGGQQFLKASPGGEARVDDVEVSCSRFVMTDEGRDNVWGYGAQDGNTTCYTGGIDAHDSRDWHIHDNVFEGIYCDATGPQRPVHGKNAGSRGGMTYNGGLAEHAIHMWDSEQGSGHLIERNRIVDCARGIGIGLRDEVYGTMIRNNTIASRFPGSREHDVGIILERAHDTKVLHNTVFYSDPGGYSSAIEYRWGSTSGVEIAHNLTNRRVRSRDGADATLTGNVTDAEAGWFVDAVNGRLGLASCGIAAVDGQAAAHADVTDDVDGQPRDGARDVGADQCVE